MTIRYGKVSAIGGDIVRADGAAVGIVQQQDLGHWTARDLELIAAGLKFPTRLRAAKWLEARAKAKARLR